MPLVLFLSIAAAQGRKEVRRPMPEKSPAQKADEGIIWGSTFADYSYVAQAEDATQKGNNDFGFRRIYLGYDQSFSEHFAAQVLLEADQFDTDSTGSLNFFVKHAYIEWKDLVPLSSISFGLSQTPSMSLSEKIWGYRSLEKVILDRHGLVASSDMGAGIKGSMVSDGSIGYAVMVGNGAGTKVENDKFKKIYGEFYFDLMKGGVFELYGDYENTPTSQPRMTGKGLFGYQSPEASFGLEGFYRKIQNGSFSAPGVQADSNLAGGSIYTSFHIAENLRAVLRGDYYDADLSVTSAGFRETFGIAGIDYSPGKGVDVIPNVLYTHLLYKNKQPSDPSLVDDITVRLTVAYAFSARVL